MPALWQVGRLAVSADDASLIERMAQAMYERPHPGYKWAKAKRMVKDEFRADAAAALAAVREQERGGPQ